MNTTTVGYKAEQADEQSAAMQTDADQVASAYHVTAANATADAPRALVVFLENIGHIAGISLPQWTMNLIDFVTEEYAKFILRLYGAHRLYDKVIILEDQDANGPALADALVGASRAHTVDVLLLVHGLEGSLLGFKGKKYVGAETFQPLCDACHENPNLLNLRMVYGVNCHGATLAATWLEMGAQAVNGAIGVNWMPEPSLTVFLRDWLGGKPYSGAVQRSNLFANWFWRRIWKPNAQGQEHAFIDSSRQIVFGKQDITIHSV